MFSNAHQSVRFPPNSDRLPRALKQFADSLKLFDFSTAQGYLIPSVPGYHTGEEGTERNVEGHKERIEGDTEGGVEDG